MCLPNSQVIGSLLVFSDVEGLALSQPEVAIARDVSVLAGEILEARRQQGIYCLQNCASLKVLALGGIVGFVRAVMERSARWRSAMVCEADGVVLAETVGELQQTVLQLQAEVERRLHLLSSAIGVSSKGPAPPRILRHQRASRASLDERLRRLISVSARSSTVSYESSCEAAVVDLRSPVLHLLPSEHFALIAQAAAYLGSDKVSECALSLHVCAWRWAAKNESDAMKHYSLRLGYVEVSLQALVVRDTVLLCALLSFLDDLFRDAALSIHWDLSADSCTLRMQVPVLVSQQSSEARLWMANSCGPVPSPPPQPL